MTDSPSASASAKGPGMSLLSLANPTRFLGFAKVLIPAFSGLAVLLGLIGLYLVFAVVPDDYQQGQTVKIMYVHVPAAWIAMGGYTLMALSALGTLVWKHPLADVSQKAMAPLGAAFTLICLVTGALWGRPMWGTWWVWDARLTSVLVLFLMYCGLIALWSAIEDQTRAARAAAILTLVGFLNIPIVKFSVDWWNTLHQPASVVRLDGPSIHPSMLWPLLIMALAFLCLFIALHLMGMRNEILRRRVQTLGMRAAREAA
jgi:heme exporter protein C